MVLSVSFIVGLTAATVVKAKTWRSLGKFEITYYCTGACCNGNSLGITASGRRLTPEVSIAVDPRIIPLGSKVRIGGKVYRADDTGGAIVGNRIDVCVSSHAKACRLGRTRKTVYVKK